MDSPSHVSICRFVLLISLSSHVVSALPYFRNQLRSLVTDDESKDLSSFLVPVEDSTLEDLHGQDDPMERLALVEKRDLYPTKLKRFDFGFMGLDNIDFIMSSLDQNRNARRPASSSNVNTSRMAVDKLRDLMLKAG